MLKKLGVCLFFTGVLVAPVFAFGPSGMSDALAKARAGSAQASSSLSSSSHSASKSSAVSSSSAKSSTHYKSVGAGGSGMEMTNNRNVTPSPSVSAPLGANSGTVRHLHRCSNSSYTDVQCLDARGPIAGSSVFRNVKEFKRCYSAGGHTFCE